MSFGAQVAIAGVVIVGAALLFGKRKSTPANDCTKLESRKRIDNWAIDNGITIIGSQTREGLPNLPAGTKSPFPVQLIDPGTDSSVNIRISAAVVFNECAVYQWTGTKWERKDALTQNMLTSIRFQERSAA